MCLAGLDYPTSLMIKNIPTRAKMHEVVQAVDELGYKGAYNFFYLPDRVVTSSRKAKTMNYGYAFINFKEPEVSKEFMDTLQNYSVSLRSSEKVLTCCHAHVQGVEALIACTENTRGAERLVEDDVTGVLMPLVSKGIEVATDAPKTLLTAKPPTFRKPAAVKGCFSKQDFQEHVSQLVPAVAIARSMLPPVPPAAAQQAMYAQQYGGSANDVPMYIMVDAKFYEDVAMSHLPPGLCVHM
eukprot:TRINITY_DN112610_c0_g1_i1.p1 TRINITY_DN112610_c0_g1~~TRINITY_DN112610_c0_g1_i1.p1  ORF type:complete len:240 (-),score=64.61 TRINITY_DN112610_c0_g1_i1:197-916(-)